MENELLDPVLAFRGLSDEDDEDAGDIDLDDAETGKDDGEDDIGDVEDEDDDKEEEPM